MLAHIWWAHNNLDGPHAFAMDQDGGGGQMDQVHPTRSEHFSTPRRGLSSRSAWFLDAVINPLTVGASDFAVSLPCPSHSHPAGVSSVRRQTDHLAQAAGQLQQLRVAELPQLRQAEVLRGVFGLLETQNNQKTALVVPSSGACLRSFTWLGLGSFSWASRIRLGSRDEKTSTGGAKKRGTKTKTTSPTEDQFPFFPLARVMIGRQWQASFCHAPKSIGL